MKKGKILAFAFLLALIWTGTAFSQGLDIGGQAPTFTSIIPGLAEALNSALNTEFQNALDNIRGEIGDINARPTNFIQAWGNSASFASHAATQRNLVGGFDLFALTVGAMAGVQLPSNPWNIGSELDSLADTLNREGDLGIGFNPQAFMAQVSVNTSRFLVEDLHLGIRFGFSRFDNLIDGLAYNTWTLGALANYQFIPRRHLAGRFIQWGGVNFGSGLVFSRTNVGYGLDLDPFRTDGISVSAVGQTLSAGLEVLPKLVFNMRINTVTIPLEAMTSIQLLTMNFSFGLGVDVVFGSSDVRIGMDGDINVTGLPAGGPVTTDQNGYLSLSAGGRECPTVLNPKIMTGLGFMMGPVIMDIPITWYFVNNGFSAGVTFGIRF